MADFELPRDNYLDSLYNHKRENSYSGYNSLTGSSRMANSDQRFLLYFITGTYFGPDLKEQCPKKSILQRRAEGLSAYTSDELAGSHMKTVEMERIYYHALRKADESLSVELPLLHHFFHGTLPTTHNDPSVAYPQFPELFPPELHPHSQLKNKHKIIENIIFINDPDTSYIKPDDIDRFKKLTGLQKLRLDQNAARFHIFGDDKSLHNVLVQKAGFVAEFPPVEPFHSSSRAKHPASTLQTENGLSPLQRDSAVPTRTAENGCPGMLFLPSCPNKEELARIVVSGKSGFAVTGSAAMGKVGPIIDSWTLVNVTMPICFAYPFLE